MARMSFALGEKAAGTVYPLIVGNAAGVIIAALKIIIATRLLGPALFGSYVFIVGYYMLIGSVNDFGVSSYFKKRAAELDYKKDGVGMQRMLSAGFLFVTVVGLLLAVLGVVLSGWVSGSFGNAVGATQPLLEIGSLVLFATIMFGALSSVLIGLGEGKSYSIAYLTYMAVDFIVTVYLLVAGYGVFGVLMGTLAGCVIGLVVAMFYTGRHLSKYMDFCPWNPEKEGVRRVFRFASPLAVNNFLANSLSSFSVLLLGVFVSSVVLGNYGTALRGLFVLGVFYASVVNVMLPTFSEAAQKNRDREHGESVYNASVMYSVFLMFPILLYFAVFSKPLIFIFIGSSYSVAPVYLSFIAIGTLLGLIGMFASALLTARGMTVKLLKYGAASAALQFVSMLAFVPVIGVFGAIASIFFIGSIANTMLFSYAVRKILGIALQKTKLAKLCVASAAAVVVMLVPLLLLHSLAEEAAAGLILLIVAYPAFTALLHVMGKAELRYLQEVTKNLMIIGPLIGGVCRYMSFISAYD